jgi:molybdopterin/thiamine biosynthesis adenylyltransferase
MISRYSGPLTMISLLVPRQTPCYRCLVHQFPTMGHEVDQTWQPLYPPPSGHAVIAPVAGISGQLAALDAICHLTGMPTQTAGRLFRQNLVVYDHNYYFDLEFWPECPDCGGARSAVTATGTGRW